MRQINTIISDMMWCTIFHQKCLINARTKYYNSLCSSEADDIKSINTVLKEHQISVRSMGVFIEHWAEDWIEPTIYPMLPITSYCHYCSKCQDEKKPNDLFLLSFKWKRAIWLMWQDLFCARFKGISSSEGSIMFCTQCMVDAEECRYIELLVWPS